MTDKYLRIIDTICVLRIIHVFLYPSETLPSLGIMGTQLRGSLKLLEYHGYNGIKGLKKSLQSVPPLTQYYFLVLYTLYYILVCIL